MITFWVVAGIMMLLGLVILVPSLSGRKQYTDLNRDEQNVQIAKERLAELELDLKNGNLGQEEYDQSRKELEQTLLDNITQEDEQVGSKTKTHPDRMILVMLAIAIPAISIPMYFLVGTPEMLDMKPMQTSSTGHSTPTQQQTGQISLEQMIEKLAVRLQEQPGDSKGWMMLGRSYMHLQQYPDAATAFKKAYELIGDNPDVLLYYADALAMTNGGRLAGEPAKFINMALQARPSDPKGLWLAGMAAEEEGNHETALRHWRKLEPLLVNDQESLIEIRNLISQVERKSGIDSSTITVPVQDTQKQASPGPSIRVQVELSQDIKDQIQSDDTVFIFARAAQGPPMPLAVARKKASDLPLTVVLDDSMAMTQGMGISNFTEVQIAARISKTGNALPQSGDFTSNYVITKNDSKDVVSIVIDQKIQ